MRPFIIAAVVMLFTACNNQSSGDGKNNPDSTDTRDTVVNPPLTPAEPDTIFTAFGNEPFWALYVIRGSKLLFHPADGPDVEAPWVEPTVMGPDAQRYTSAGDSAAIELNIIKKDCSDGMSDLTHRFETKVKVNAVTYQGCGRE